VPLLILILLCGNLIDTVGLKPLRMEKTLDAEDPVEIKMGAVSHLNQPPRECRVHPQSHDDIRIGRLLIRQKFKDATQGPQEQPKLFVIE